jgi:hypothetical protein
MEKIIFGVILAFLPLISFFIQKKFCAHEHKLRLFKRYPMVFYVDWIFVLFNLFLPLVVSANYDLWLLVFVIILIANLVFYNIWARIHIREKNPIDLYDIKQKRITHAGKVHLIYAQIQAFLVFIFIFSNVINIFVYLELLFLLIYFIGGLFSSKAIHGKIILADWILMGIGFLAVVGKLVWMTY